MGFDNDISDRVAKIRAATLLGEVVRLHQRTKNLLKHVHTNSKYGHLVAIPDSDTQELFSRSVRDKGYFEKIIFHSSGGKEEKNMAMSHYLSKYLFDKYEDEAILPLLNVGCLSELP